ncbi:exocyst complex component EXO70E2-like isoform X2 [Lolium rigidum]|nr:exocyst complex component EXO70E2-like isoform X2 [Lolium rigidum]
MIRDRYTQRIVQEFEDAPSDALGRWFSELDVDWVLQIREGCGLRELEAGRSESSFQDFVERWIRALAIIVLSMRELHLMTIGEPTSAATARFGKASILAMLVFVDAIVIPAAPKGHGPGDRLWALLNMYVCISDASSFKWSGSRRPIPLETQSIIDEINGSLSAEENKLNGAIFSTMEEIKTFMEEEDSWAAEIPRGGGEVHRNTQFIVDCVVLIRSAVLNYHFENLRALLHDTTDYLKDLLWRKSKLCSDQSLRYLFLLNNSCFITQQLESTKLIAWVQNHWELPPESKKYIDCYFEVSWAHVLSCISESNLGPLRRWNNGSSLARFLSAFDRIYKLQKFWKVPSPELRRMMRKTITERVIAGYREYLEEHPELEKRIIFGNTTPDELEEMLGELFEG